MPSPAANSLKIRISCRQPACLDLPSSLEIRSSRRQPTCPDMPRPAASSLKIRTPCRQPTCLHLPSPTVNRLSCRISRRHHHPSMGDGCKASLLLRGTAAILFLLADTGSGDAKPTSCDLLCCSYSCVWGGRQGDPPCLRSAARLLLPPATGDAELHLKLSAYSVEVATLLPKVPR